MPKTITVGVDIRDLRVARTGTGTYLQEICDEFKAIHKTDIVFYFFDTSWPIYSGENKLFKLIGHLGFYLWKQVILPLKAALRGCDILFCTDYVVPYLQIGFKTIPVFHDVLIFKYPEHYNRSWLKVFTKAAVSAARKSPVIIVPTTYIKNQLTQYTGISQNKIVAIAEGPKTFVKSETEGNALEQLLQRYSLEREKYILHVGILNKRKNIPRLIQAFAQLKKEGYSFKLVLAGTTMAKKHSNDLKEIKAAIQKYQLQEDVIMTGYLSVSDLNLIYTGALMYVFPSVSEGFGIPVLEAFAHNVPVLVANNSCLPEVGGNAVVEFDPYLPEDIFLKMKRLADDNELREQLIENGKVRLQQFSWNNAAEQLITVFRQVSKS